MWKNLCLFVCQVNERLILEVEKSIKVTEDIIIDLNKERKELTDLWAIWNFKITQVKPIKQQCQIFQEQLKIVSKIARKKATVANISRLLLACLWLSHQLLLVLFNEE